MRVVVHPRQQTNEEEDARQCHQAAEGRPRMSYERPAVDDLHEEAGQKAELRARWTDLGPVRDKDGRCQVAGDARNDVNDANPDRARKLL